MLLIFLMYAISATTFLLGKQLLLYSSPLFLVGLRTGIAGLLLLLMVLCTNKQLLLKFRKFLLPCAAIAFYSFYLSNTLKFWALQHISAINAMLISVSEPLFAMILAYCMFHEQMSLKKLIGLICCMSSGFMLANNGLFLSNICRADFSFVSTIILCVATCASAYGALLMRKIIRDADAPPIIINGLSMAIAGIFALSSCYFEPVSCTVTSETIMPFAGNLMLMIVLSNIIAYSLYGQLLKQYSVLLISCGSFVKPIFTIFYKAIWLHELIPWYTSYAGFLLLFGLAIIYSDEYVPATVII